MKIGQALGKLCDAEKSVVVDVEGYDTWQLLDARTHWLAGANGMINCPMSYHPGYRLVSTVLRLGSRWRVYTVNQRILVAKSTSDADMKDDLADAVHEAFCDLFAAQLMLGDGNTFVDNFRTEEDTTVGRMDVDDGFVSLSHVLDLHLYDQPLIGPGD